MKAAGIKIYHLSKWMLFALLISLALLSIAGRVLLDNVMHFKSDIVAELAGFGIKGVELENIEGHWQGLHPVLKIKGLHSACRASRTRCISVNCLYALSWCRAC